MSFLPPSSFLFSFLCIAFLYLIISGVCPFPLCLTCPPSREALQPFIPSLSLFFDYGLEHPIAFLKQPDRIRSLPKQKTLAIIYTHIQRDRNWQRPVKHSLPLSRLKEIYLHSSLQPKDIVREITIPTPLTLDYLLRCLSKAAPPPSFPAYPTYMCGVWNS